MAAALTAAALSCTASPARGRFQRININCSLSNKIVPNISSGSITLDLIFFPLVAAAKVEKRNKFLLGIILTPWIQIFSSSPV